MPIAIKEFDSTQKSVSLVEPYIYYWILIFLCIITNINITYMYRYKKYR